MSRTIRKPTLKIVKHPSIFNIWDIWMKDEVSLWAEYFYAEIRRDEDLKEYIEIENLIDINNNNYVVAANHFKKLKGR